MMILGHYHKPIELLFAYDVPKFTDFYGGQSCQSICFHPHSGERCITGGKSGPLLHGISQLLKSCIKV